MPLKRVLVTGGRGFIGSHCLEPLIARGYEVHVASRDISHPIHNRLYWHEADLLDANAAKRVLLAVRPSHLLHLAWYVVPGRLISADENYLWVTSSLALVRQFAAFGGRRVVAAGSSYEYDWNYGYCSETRTPIAPDNVYGACKHALHVMLEAVASTAALSFAWPRIFFLYGPNEHPDRLVSYIIRSLQVGEPAKCSRGTQVRDYLYVQDVADALVSVLDSDLQGPVNVASGLPITIAEIARAIGRLTGKPSLIELGAQPARPNDKPLVVANIDRLTSVLSWKPRYGLEEGLSQTISWWHARSSVASVQETR